LESDSFNRNGGRIFGVEAANACPSGVLVVDDDEDLRESIRDILENEGYTVRSAANGEEALERLAESAPCLMLLDMMMPVMSGAEVLSELEQRNCLGALPVVVVSAHVTHCAGVREVLRKPVLVDVLLEVVARYCVQPSDVR
jgi:CheY-like chemotaxis protein